MKEVPMRFLATALGICLSIGWPAMPALGGDKDQFILDSFDNNPKERWEFIADSVMGGVSTGQVNFASENGSGFARLTGSVSTENRGGFIQFRRKLSEKLANDTRGVRLIVRGNDQQYFVHIRTSGTVLPVSYTHLTLPTI